MSRSRGPACWVLALAASACVPDTPAPAAGEDLPRSVALRVTGHDFKWYIRYAGLDGELDTKDDVVSQRHLDLPANAEVTVDLQSRDYVYSFFVPEVDLIEAAVPEIPIEIGFETDTPGTLQLRGSQMCGFAHPELLGRVAVHARSDFDAWLTAGGVMPGDVPLGADGAYHVRPGMDIQDAIETAARDAEHNTVKVHAGTYRPRVAGQAMIWFNAAHDGVVVQAVGDVTLTAANPEISDPSREGHPAVVNHVVYFGEGITRRTVLDGFKITGGNSYVTDAEAPGPIEPSTLYPKTLFFYADGGGIKIFGRSYPTLQNLEIHDNYASPCAGGISVHHPHSVEDPRRSPFDEDKSVLMRNCKFRNNRARVTGSGVDLLWGSSAILENCLFVGNISNTGTDPTVPEGQQPQYSAAHGCGALTVFWGSRVRVLRCTFTANYNGVDDMSVGNSYGQSIFWRNQADGGISPEGRYEVALRDGKSLRGCFVGGNIPDLQDNISRRINTFDPPDPQFDAEYRPTSPAYKDVGYRPPESARDLR